VKGISPTVRSTKQRFYLKEAALAYFRYCAEQTLKRLYLSFAQTDDKRDNKALVALL